MLPPLADMKNRSRSGHTYIEDEAGDGALIGIARDDDGVPVGVELVTAMNVSVEHDEDCDGECGADDEPLYAMAILFFSPENARELALHMTKTSIEAESAGAS